MTYMKIVLAFLTCIFLSSCGEYINFDYPVHEEKIFVESYITENDSFAVVILQKTLDPFLDAGITADSLIKANGANVSIISENKTVSLESMGANSWKYTMGKGTAYYAKTRINEQQKYLLSIEYKEQKLTAFTSFPSKTRITSPVIKYDYSNRNHIINARMNLISADNAIKHYRIKIKFDITLNNTKFPVSTPYYYLNFSGQEKTIDLNQIMRNNMDSYSGSENQKPEKATVILERISDLYYNFKEAVDVQKDDNDTFLGSEVTEIPSNITGGYGIFTGITRDTVCTDISK